MQLIRTENNRKATKFIVWKCFLRRLTQEVPRASELKANYRISGEKLEVIIVLIPSPPPSFRPTLIIFSNYRNFLLTTPNISFVRDELEKLSEIRKFEGHLMSRIE